MQEDVFKYLGSTLQSNEQCTKEVKKRGQGGMGGTGIVPAVRAGGPPAVTLYTCKNSCGRLPPTMLKPKP